MCFYKCMQHEIPVLILKCMHTYLCACLSAHCKHLNIFTCVNVYVCVYMDMDYNLDNTHFCPNTVYIIKM